MKITATKVEPAETVDFSIAKIYWPDGEPSGDIVAQVRENIATELNGSGLPKASDLMYHVVDLGKNDDGTLRSVVLSGNEENDGFTARYEGDHKPVTFRLDDLNEEVVKKLREVMGEDVAEEVANAFEAVTLKDDDGEDPTDE